MVLGKSVNDKPPLVEYFNPVNVGLPEFETVNDTVNVVKLGTTPVITGGVPGLIALETVEVPVSLNAFNVTVPPEELIINGEPSVFGGM